MEEKNQALKILKILKDEHWSNERIARALNCACNSVSRWLNGHEMSIHLAEKIIKTFKIK